MRIDSPVPRFSWFFLHKNINTQTHSPLTTSTLFKLSWSCLLVFFFELWIPSHVHLLLLPGLGFLSLRAQSPPVWLHESWSRPPKGLDWALPAYFCAQNSLSPPLTVLLRDTFDCCCLLKPPYLSNRHMATIQGCRWETIGLTTYEFLTMHGWWDVVLEVEWVGIKAARALHRVIAPFPLVRMWADIRREASFSVA